MEFQYAPIIGLTTYLMDHYWPQTDRFSSTIKQNAYAFVFITLNTLRTKQNGRYFPDDIFKCIFFHGNIWILFKISLKFVTKGLTIFSIGLGNCLAPSRRQAIIWTNYG